MVALNENLRAVRVSAVNAHPRALPARLPRARFRRRRTGGYQCNWLTLKIGAKWWGLSPSRLYDFATGRFTQRDPLPERDCNNGVEGGIALGGTGTPKTQRRMR